MTTARYHRSVFACCVILAAATALEPEVAVQTPTLVLTHASVIDGTDLGVQPDQTVVIAGDRIAAVGVAGKVQIPAGAQVVDATGAFLIPGLWDAHVHTRYVGIDHLRLFVANGVTSARNMSGPWEHLDEVRRWREEIRAGRRIGPRLLTAGPILDGPGAGRQTNLVITDPQQARDAVRRMASAGADFIKVYNLLSLDSYRAIAEEAAAQRLPFAGHIPLTISTADAIKAGQLTIEHQEGLMLAASAREAELRRRYEGWRPTPGGRAGLMSSADLIGSFDQARLDDVARRLREGGVGVVPTLVNFRNRFRVPTDALGAECVPAAYLSAWKQSPASPADDADLYKHLQRVLRALDAAGVTILAGTDVGTPFQVSGFSLHEELELLVDAGLSEVKALQAATRNPAQVFNLTDQGTIARGMRADLVLLDANPLQDIRNTRRIRGVVLAGRMMSRGALDGMLREVRVAAAQWKGEPTR